MPHVKKKCRNFTGNYKQVLFQMDYNGSWVFLSPAWKQITGFTVEEAIGGSSFQYICDEDRQHSIDIFASFISGKRRDYRYRVHYITKEGSCRCVRIHAISIVDDKKNVLGVTGTLTEIPARHFRQKQRQQYQVFSEQQMEYMATHDYLTNIPNRYYLLEALKGLAVSDKAKAKNALLLIGLDNFKVINNSFGYMVGDCLLIRIVDVIRKNLRKEDILARLGGDEFAVILQAVSPEDAEILAYKILREVNRTEIVVDDNMKINTTASIGISIMDEKLDHRKLLSCADTALALAKEEGKNRVFTLQSDGRRTRMFEFNHMFWKIKDALKENRFRLYFQPIFKLGDGIIHYEALIRMIDPDDKIILPGKFLPIAERFGLMPEIDGWVINDAIEILRQHPHMIIFVNLSATSLGNPDLLQLIEARLNQSGIEPSRIGFEITETAAVQDVTLVDRWIQRLKCHGCKFALDDFGTGFSSFAHLQSLSVDFLKIDGSFVRNMDSDPTHYAFVKAMNYIAHALGKKTVAEFVESESIVGILRQLDVDCGQGYYFGQPVPLKDLVKEK